jgi:chromosome segregation ATPase
MAGNEEESKNFMKKLVTVIGNMSESLQKVVDKIELSNRQLALLTKKIEEMEVKIKQLDTDVEEEFTKLGKEPSSKKDYTEDLREIEKEVAELPDEVLDDELKGLLAEEEKQEKSSKKPEKGGKKKEKK